MVDGFAPNRAVLTAKDGIIRGLKTGGILLRVMIPIYLIVVFLKYTPAIPAMQRFLVPAMRVFSLPGDAAVPIVAGVFSDEYGVVAAMSGFDFTTAQITTIAMIVLCFHTIPLEAAIGRQIGFSPVKYTLYRLALAVLTGIFAGWLTGVMYGARGDAAVASATALTTDSFGTDIFMHAPWDPAWASYGAPSPWHIMADEMLWGSLSVVFSLARVIIPLMIVIEFMLAYRVVERFVPKLVWLRRVIGVSDDALLPLLIGLLMGVTYGAGTLMEINKRTPLSRRDFALIGIFLYACHGIIETTILFAVAGGSIFFVCFVRLLIAVLITAAAARLPRFKTQEENYFS
jgi:hypothetical protein